jgi:PucR C-terminal helix-turn-helix domain
MTAEVADRPWESLPPEVAHIMRPELPGLADEIIEAIGRVVPDYARPLEGPFGEGLRVGVEEALRQFVEMVEDPEAGRGAGRDVYVNLGRGEMRAGRRLDALLAAYRLGARVAWRHLAATGERAGLEPRTLYLLAESIFAYIDELSGDSIEGYAREQAAAAGEAQRRRRRLVALLVQDPPADRATVEATAAEAGWPLPRALAALAVQGEDADRLATRLGPDALVAPIIGVAGPQSAAPPILCALVADPDAPGRRAQLEAALDGRPAALGPSVPWPRAALSFARARSTLLLEGEPRAGLAVAGDHLVDLLMAADRQLAADLAEHSLAPFDSETERSRERLATTLAAWLRHRGRTEEVARALHVHPQTVRYRLGRLRELFGERLDDPDARFELELALRARLAAASGSE